jgi:hypothetical protein
VADAGNLHRLAAASAPTSAPKNISCLRRFAVGVLTSFQKPTQYIAELMRALSFRTQLVFDYLTMTNNSLTGTSGT